MGIDGSEIDLVVGSDSPDHVVPAIACVAADAIGAQRHWPLTFDLFIGCSGFVQGLDVVDGFFAHRGKKASRCCRKVTSLVDWSDRATCVPVW